MSRRIYKRVIESNKIFVRCMCHIFIMTLLIPVIAFCGSDRLVDDSDYKENKLQKCNIKDYTDMVKGDGVDWVWVKPGEKLGAYKTRVGAVLNKSDMHSSSMVSKVKSIFQDNFSGATKGTKGTLTAEVCIWEVQKYTPEKQWIPYAGGRAAQAGMGVEVVLVDRAKKTVAKIRHFDHQGRDWRDAAEDVAGHISNYVAKH